MKPDSQSSYRNMSAYVALSCLIAFAIVITICLFKQFIWDPLLSKRFETIRPVLSASVRKLSSTWNRPSNLSTTTTTTNNFPSVHKSISDACVKTSDPLLLSDKNFITTAQSLPTSSNEPSGVLNYAKEKFNRDVYQPFDTANKKLTGGTHSNSSYRSYGSSSINSHAYTNYGSEDLLDDETKKLEQENYPILHFSCEYNPATLSVRLNVQNLRNMNSSSIIPFRKNVYVLIRFILSRATTDESYETSLQQCQEFVRFGETFTILSNIQPGDILDYNVRFWLMLVTEQNMFDIGEANYNMQDDRLTQVLYVERTLPLGPGQPSNMSMNNP